MAKSGMVKNLPTYFARFFGDLGALLMGGISLIPLVYSYFKSVPVLTSETVKWGALALGFMLASYRIYP